MLKMYPQRSPSEYIELYKRKLYKLHRWGCTFASLQSYEAPPYTGDTDKLDDVVPYTNMLSKWSRCLRKADQYRQEHYELYVRDQEDEGHYNARMVIKYYAEESVERLEHFMKIRQSLEDIVFNTKPLSRSAKKRKPKKPVVSPVITPKVKQVVYYEPRVKIKPTLKPQVADDMYHYDLYTKAYMIKILYMVGTDPAYLKYITDCRFLKSTLAYMRNPNKAKGDVITEQGLFKLSLCYLMGINEFVDITYETLREHYVKAWTRESALRQLTDSYLLFLINFTLGPKLTDTLNDVMLTLLGPLKDDNLVWVKVLRRRLHTFYQYHEEGHIEIDLVMFMIKYITYNEDKGTCVCRGADLDRDFTNYLSNRERRQLQRNYLFQYDPAVHMARSKYDGRIRDDILFNKNLLSEQLGRLTGADKRMTRSWDYDGIPTPMTEPEGEDEIAFKQTYSYINLSLLFHEVDWAPHDIDHLLGLAISWLPQTTGIVAQLPRVRQWITTLGGKDKVTVLYKLLHEVEGATDLSRLGV